MSTRKANLIATLIVVGSTISAAHAQSDTPYLTFDQVPYRYTQSPQLFEALFDAAHHQTVRLSILGDSQETSPGGAGYTLIPRVGYEFYNRYGNVPETQVIANESVGGRTGTPAEFLLRASAPSPGPSDSRVASSFLLPGFSHASAHASTQSGLNINGQEYGQLTMLRHDATRVSSGARLPTDINYFDPSGDIRVEVFAATNPSSGEIAYAARPVDEDLDFFAPRTTTGTINLSLEDETFAVRSGLTDPLDFNGKHYMAVEAYGTDDNKLTDILGMRFVNTSRPEGVVVQDLSVGGYGLRHFLNNHENAGQMYAAMGFDAAVLTYGANDATLPDDIEEYHDQIVEAIARIRSWVGREDYPIILVTDPDQDELSPNARVRASQQAGLHYAIAQQDPYVLSVNQRRTLHDAYWSVDSPFFVGFHSDAVHYSAAGARIAASAMVAGILGESWSFELEKPDDFNFDGKIDGADQPLLEYLLDAGDPAADINEDGLLNSDDLDLWVARYRSRPIADANLDGTVDLLDLSALASHFNQPGSWADGDFNYDGIVNLLDLSLLASHWGETSTIPEPGITLLIAAAALIRPKNSA